MKRIGLLSDTHSYLDPAVLRHFEHCDEIWHAGDVGDIQVVRSLQAIKPVRAVFGNIDDAGVRSEFPEHLHFEIEKVDVWMTHIGGRPGNYAKPIQKTMKEKPPKLFICGHSHICLVKYDKEKDVLHMNPGAAGKHGFHKMRTLLRFELNNGSIENLDLIELGPRVGE
jgi:putative phosphoesterase